MSAKHLTWAASEIIDECVLYDIVDFQNSNAYIYYTTFLKKFDIDFDNVEFDYFIMNKLKNTKDYADIYNS